MTKRTRSIVLRDSFRSRALREGRTVDSTIRTRTETQCDDRTGDRQRDEKQTELRVRPDRCAGSDRPCRLPPEEGRERPGDGEIRPEIEPDEQGAEMRRRLGGEDDGRRKVVDDDGAERADRRGLPPPAPGEQARRAAPRAGERAQSRGDDKEQRQHAQVEPRPDPPEGRRSEPDGEHRNRSVPQHEDERSRSGDRRDAEPEDERRRVAARRPSLAEAVGRDKHGGGDRAGREPRREHLEPERGAADRFPAQHEQVRQVRPGQQQRGGVGHEDRAVEERPLVEPPPPRREHEDRRQEDDRRVEVEQRRYDRDEAEQRDEEPARPERRAGEPSADRLEEPVAGRDGADQEQPGHEHERWPDVSGCG
jgi:hypothetical protein